MQNDYLEVTCVVEFFGYLKPSFVWLDNRGKAIQTASYCVTEKVVSTVLIRATIPVIEPLRFVTWMPDVPERLYSWNSTNFTVCKSE